jgi:hypothetical protein
MERVVTINLNGNPYQLEEPAYDALRAYMDRARTALSANPDQAEIVRDLEQAIADKCSGYLSPSKSVVSATEMARILDEMGPVEGGAANSEQTAGAGAAPNDGSFRPDRRLYRIYERGAWTGVSAGLSAYTGIDVAWFARSGSSPRCSAAASPRSSTSSWCSPCRSRPAAKTWLPHTARRSTRKK